MAAPRLVVIGAGPSGLDAALRGVDRGWEVTVLEAHAPGHHQRQWGWVRLFTPMSMNCSPLAREVLGARAPSPDALLTGEQYAAQVLAPLAEHLGDRVKAQHKVISVSRRRLLRSELPNHPLRAKRPFELLVETPQGERVFVADGVLDATGIYATPRWMGRGGAPVPGERAARVTRHMPNIEAEPDRWRDARVALVGNGYSAATTLRALAALRAEAGGGAVAWLVPDDRAKPVDEVAQDPLPERQAVSAAANALATHPPPWLTVHRRAVIHAISDGALDISVRAGACRVPFDEVVSLTGFGPSPELLSEVAVELDPNFGGGRGLAQALARVTDCLAKVEVSASDLGSGEPDLYLVGHRAYGRRNTFLMQSGLEQLDVIFQGWKLTRKEG